MNAPQLTKVIYNYVAEHFGENEADDPSWNIEALAAEIATKLTERQQATERLAYLRDELTAERISTSELAELQDLIPYMNGDMVLLEAAGVPEYFANRQCKTCGEVLPIKDNVQSGYYCCDEYYCSKPCVNASFAGQLNDDDEPMTFDDHYSDDGDCYWTEWEAEEQ